MNKRESVPLEHDGWIWTNNEGSILIPAERSVTMTTGIRLRSQGKWSKNWRADYGRTVALRAKIARALSVVPAAAVTAHLGGRVRRIVFTRLAPRLLDDDNLAFVLKPVRDQVCAWLGGQNNVSARADDGMRSGYTFEYRQRQQKAYGLQVELS